MLHKHPLLKVLLLLLLLNNTLMAALEFSATSIDLGTVSTSGSAASLVTLTNNDLVTHNVDYIGDAAGLLVVNPGNAVLNAGASILINISFLPDQNMAFSGLLVAGSEKGAIAIPWSANGDIPGSDWDSTFDLSGEALMTQLENLVSGHNVLDYTSAREAMFEDISNVGGWVESVYTGFMLQTWTIPDHTIMNTEHTWPQSYGAEGDARSDLHHLFPCKSTINSSRGNLPFGNVVISSSGYPQGGADRGDNAQGIVVFEPRQQHKGDCARSTLYFALRYGNREGFLNLADQEPVLRAWSDADIVDSWEESRNDAIETYQNNRNPFVDFPQFLERIASFSASANLPVSAELFSFPASLDMGEQAAINPDAAYILIYNSGDANMSIYSQSVSPACFTVEALPASLSSGEWQLLEVNVLGDCGSNPLANCQIQTSAGTINIPLSATLQSGEFLSPELSIVLNLAGASIQWDAVPGAENYRLEYSFNAYGPWNTLITTPNTHYDDAPTTFDALFFRVIAQNSAQ
jgi:deoxyribonuclease I